MPKTNNKNELEENVIEQSFKISMKKRSRSELKSYTNDIHLDLITQTSVFDSTTGKTNHIASTTQLIKDLQLPYYYDDFLFYVDEFDGHPLITLFGNKQNKIFVEYYWFNTKTSHFVNIRCDFIGSSLMRGLVASAQIEGQLYTLTLKNGQYKFHSLYVQNFEIGEEVQNNELDKEAVIEIKEKQLFAEFNLLLSSTIPNSININDKLRYKIFFIETIPFVLVFDEDFNNLNVFKIDNSLGTQMAKAFAKPKPKKGILTTSELIMRKPTPSELMRIPNPDSLQNAVLDGHLDGVDYLLSPIADLQYSFRNNVEISLIQNGDNKLTIQSTRNEIVGQDTLKEIVGQYTGYKLYPLPTQNDKVGTFMNSSVKLRTKIYYDGDIDGDGNLLLKNILLNSTDSNVPVDKLHSIYPSWLAINIWENPINVEYRPVIYTYLDATNDSINYLTAFATEKYPNNPKLQKKIIKAAKEKAWFREVIEAAKEAHDYHKETNSVMLKRLEKALPPLGGKGEKLAKLVASLGDKAIREVEKVIEKEMRDIADSIRNREVEPEGKGAPIDTGHPNDDDGTVPA